MRNSNGSKPFGTKGYTPLQEATWGGNVDGIEALVRHGAALDATVAQTLQTGSERLGIRDG